MKKLLALSASILAIAGIAHAQPNQNPVQWNYSFHNGNQALATYPGDVQVNGNFNPLGPSIAVGSNLVPTIVAPVNTVATSSGAGSPVITVSAAVAANLYPGENANSATITGGTNNTVLSVAGTNVTLLSNAAGAFTNSPITFGLQRYDVNSSLIVNTIGAQTGLFGQAAINNGNWTGIYDGPGRFSTNNGTGPGIGAIQAISLTGGRAIYGAARSSDSLASGLQGIETQELQGICDTAVSVYPGCGWTQYLEGNVTTTLAPYANSEYLITESDFFSAWTVAAADPYSINNQHHTAVLRAAAGKGVSTFLGLTGNNITTGTECVPNPQLFEACLLVANGALDVTGGYGSAVLMPDDTGFTWNSAAATMEAQIFAKVTGGFPAVFFNTAANGSWNFEVGGTQEIGINSATLFPVLTNSYALGSASNAFSSLYVDAEFMAGAVPTNSGTCAINTQVGGKTAGSFKANGACAAGTIILALPTAPTGWNCNAQDMTTTADTLKQTAYSTTSCTLTATLAASDQVVFAATGF